MKDILESSKRLRRKMLLRRFSVRFFIFVLLLAGFVGFFYIPVFRIKNISLEGASFVSSGEIISEANSYLAKRYIGVLPYDSIFLFRKADIIKNLKEKFPRIKDVSLSLNIRRILKISIFERKMAALWCKKSETGDDDCAFLDDEGVTFSKAPYFSGPTLFKIYDEKEENNFSLGEAVFPKKFLSDIFSFNDSFKKDYGKDLVSLAVKSNGVLEFITAEGWKIIMNDSLDFHQAFENLKIAFKSSIQESKKLLDYIDLRFGNKVFYKFK